MQPRGEGERYGNYVVTSLIGAGGMGAVYRAVHPEIGKVVAIKVLRPELARDDAAVRRFFDEARAVNAIRHEGIVDIFDFGRRDDGTVYCVMEYLVGEDLSRVLQREKRMPPARAVAFVRRVCAALGAAHRRGIVHRDLKPQNLFVLARSTGGERVKVLDFGIAKLLHATQSAANTTDGVVLGTPQYMSPEQARGEAVDQRSDLYGIGGILYELLTGTPPFQGANFMQVMSRLATETAEPPSRRAPDAGIGAELDAVVLRALAKEPGERYLDAEELSEALGGLGLANVPSPLPQMASAPSPRETAPAPVDPVAPTIDFPKPPPEGPPPPEEAAVPRTPSGRERTIPADSGPHPLPAPLSTDSARIRAEAPPLIDADSERRIVRITMPIVVALFVAGVVFYLLPETATTMDRAELQRWLPLFGGAVIGIGALMVMVVRTQQRSRARWVVNRALSLLAVATISTAVHCTGSLTSYDILYYPLLVMLDRLREDRALARVTLLTSVFCYVTVVLFEHLGLSPYAPLYPGRYSPSLIGDTSLIALVVFVVCGAMLVTYYLTDHLATRVQRREVELREITRQQLKLKRDMARYLPPQLTDAIERGEAHGEPGHERRRLTFARVDCPALARAAESTEPEELAGLFNDFFTRVADLAVAHGGTVERFSGARLSVLFGAPESAGKTEDALAAMRFARAVLPAVKELSLRCEAAGVPEPPEARVAVHTGFATAGSFGSSRLEYTAVGPQVDAVSALLRETKPGEVLLSHATWVLVRDEVPVEEKEARALPGAGHPVKLYRAV